MDEDDELVSGVSVLSAWLPDRERPWQMPFVCARTQQRPATPRRLHALRPPSLSASQPASQPRLTVAGPVRDQNPTIHTRLCVSRSTSTK